MPQITFLTNHGRVFVTIAERGEITSERLIADVGLSARAVRQTLADLIATGLVEQKRDTDRTVYCPRGDLRLGSNLTRQDLLGPVLVAMLTERGPVGAPGRDEMQRRMLAAVERLFDDGETFRELSVERLIGEAGISRATFYAYFDDKSALLEALSADVTESVVTAGQYLSSLEGPPTREQVHEGVRRVAAVYLHHRGIMSALTDTALASVVDAKRFALFSQRIVSELTSYYERGQAAGFVDATLAPGGAAHWITWMAIRGLQRLVAPADDAEVERLVGALGDIVWNLVYATAA